MPEWPTRRAKQANRGSILRSCAPLAYGSVKKPTRPQTGPFLGVGKCIPGPLRVRIAPSGAKFSGGELVVRGSAGFFTNPYAAVRGRSSSPLATIKRTEVDRRISSPRRPPCRLPRSNPMSTTLTLRFALAALWIASIAASAADFKRDIIYQIVTDRFFDGDSANNNPPAKQRPLRLHQDQLASLLGRRSRRHPAENVVHRGYGCHRHLDLPARRQRERERRRRHHRRSLPWLSRQ